MKFIKIAALSVLASVMGVANYSTAIATNHQSAPATTSGIEKLLLKALGEEDRTLFSMDNVHSFSSNDIQRISDYRAAQPSEDGMGELDAALEYISGSGIKEVKDNGETKELFETLAGVAPNALATVNVKNYAPTANEIEWFAKFVDGVVKKTGLGAKGLLIAESDDTARKAFADYFTKNSIKDIQKNFITNYDYTGNEEGGENPIDTAFETPNGDMVAGINNELNQVYASLGLKPSEEMKWPYTLPNKDSNSKEKQLFAFVLNAYLLLEDTLNQLYAQQENAAKGDVMTAYGSLTDGYKYASDGQKALKIEGLDLQNKDAAYLRSLSNALKSDDLNQIKTLLPKSTEIDTTQLVRDISQTAPKGRLLPNADFSEYVEVIDLSKLTLNELVKVRDQLAGNPNKAFDIFSTVTGAEKKSVATDIANMFPGGSLTIGNDKITLKDGITKEQMFDLVKAGRGKSDAGLLDTLKRLAGVKFEKVALIPTNAADQHNQSNANETLPQSPNTLGTAAFASGNDAKDKIMKHAKEQGIDLTPDNLAVLEKIDPATDTTALKTVTKKPALMKFVKAHLLGNGTGPSAATTNTPTPPQPGQQQSTIVSSPVNNSNANNTTDNGSEGNKAAKAVMDQAKSQGIDLSPDDLLAVQNMDPGAVIPNLNTITKRRVLMRVVKEHQKKSQ